MNARIARKITRRLQRWTDATPRTEPALRVCGRLYRKLVLDRPEVGDRFELVCAESLAGAKMLIGVPVDTHCVPRYQHKSAISAALSKRSNKRQIVVAYQSTGEISQFGAERLQFHHVVGTQLAVVRAFAVQP